MATRTSTTKKRTVPRGKRATTSKAAPAMTELGVSGLKYYGGIIDDEFLRELKDVKGRKVYREMADNDSTVSAALSTIRQYMRQVPISVEDGSDERAGELIRTALEDMSHTWSDALTEILTMFAFGYSMTEVVYKRRNGPHDSPSKSSRYSDGLIGWRKLAPRAQESIERWKFDDEGGIQGAWQCPPVGAGRIFLPIEKLLLFRTESVRNNPEGRSLLRGSYVPWYFLKRIRITEGIGIERDLAGLPVAWAPPEVCSSAATGDQLATQNALKDLVTNIRRDEQEGVLMPRAYDSSGNQLYDLTLLSTGGRRQFDTSEIIGRYQKDIAIAMLCDFILLGHEKVGSFALADSKTSVFALALAGWMDGVLAVFNRHAIPRLLKLNGMRVEDPPRMVRGDIETPDLATLGAYITALAGAGMPLFPNPELEDRLLTAANMPTMSGDDGVGKRSEPADMGGFRAMVGAARELREVTKVLKGAA